MTSTPSGEDLAIFGRDVLAIIADVEDRTRDPNAQLTLLTSAISLVAMHHGIRLKDLKLGLDMAYRQQKRLAPKPREGRMGDGRDIVERAQIWVAALRSDPGNPTGPLIEKLAAEILRLRSVQESDSERVGKLREAAQALLDAPFPDEETPAQYVAPMALANIEASEQLSAALAVFTTSAQDDVDAGSASTPQGRALEAANASLEREFDRALSTSPDALSAQEKG